MFKRHKIAVIISAYFFAQAIVTILYLKNAELPALNTTGLSQTEISQRSWDHFATSLGHALGNWLYFLASIVVLGLLLFSVVQYWSFRKVTWKVWIAFIAGIFYNLVALFFWGLVAWLTGLEWDIWYIPISICCFLGNSFIIIKYFDSLFNNGTVRENLRTT